MPILEQEARKLAYGNSFTADDLIQEGALAVMSALGSYNPDRGSIGGYIRACARNRMISYLRRNGHESPMEDEALGERLNLGRVPENSGGPHDVIYMREALYSLLDQLSELEAEVLHAYLRGGSVSGAREILGCGRKKVDNALQRIRQKARDMEY
jgi:RNA polymerase sporulation-specific sigma factor